MPYPKRTYTTVKRRYTARRPVRKYVKRTTRYVATRKYATKRKR